MTHTVQANTLTDHNKAVVRQFYAALDTGKLDEAFALLTPDYVVHATGQTGTRWTRGVQADCG